LSHYIRKKHHVVKDGGLHAARPKLLGRTHATPVADGLRFLPTQVAYWWLCERNAFENANARTLSAGAFYHTVGGLNSVGSLGDHQRRDEKKRCDRNDQSSRSSHFFLSSGV